MNGELATFFLAALPVTELRAALPLAITQFGLTPGSALFFSVLGNLLPLIVLFPIVPRFIRWIEARYPRPNGQSSGRAQCHAWMDRHFLSLRGRHQKAYDRYGSLFLCVFVAIPLPGSGLWTASLLSMIFQIRPRFAIPAMMIGVVLAGLIVLAITQGSLSFLKWML